MTSLHEAGKNAPLWAPYYADTAHGGVKFIGEPPTPDPEPPDIDKVIDGTLLFLLGALCGVLAAALVQP